MAKQKTKQPAATPDAKMQLKDKIKTMMMANQRDATQVVPAPQSYEKRVPSMSADQVIDYEKRVWNDAESKRMRMQDNDMTVYNGYNRVPAQEDTMQPVDKYGNVSKQRVTSGTDKNAQGEELGAYAREQARNKMIEEKRRKGTLKLQDLIMAKPLS